MGKKLLFPGAALVLLVGSIFVNPEPVRTQVCNRQECQGSSCGTVDDFKDCSDSVGCEWWWCI